MIIRTPVVPGVNDLDEDIRRVAEFVGELDGLRRDGGSTNDRPIEYELLRFHRLAADKYSSLGLEYGASAIEPPTTERMMELAGVAKGCGVETRIR